MRSSQIKDLYSKYAREHIHRDFFMSSAWMIKGYDDYKVILSDPDTPSRRRAIMARNIRIIDAAAANIPKEYRQAILDKLKYSRPLPPYDKKIKRHLVDFIVEVSDGIIDSLPV